MRFKSTQEPFSSSQCVAGACVELHHLAHLAQRLVCTVGEAQVDPRARAAACHLTIVFGELRERSRGVDVRPLTRQWREKKKGSPLGASARPRKCAPPPFFQGWRRTGNTADDLQLWIWHSKYSIGGARAAELNHLIPQLDLRRFDAGQEQRADFLAQLRAAAHDTGFFLCHRPWHRRRPAARGAENRRNGSSRCQNATSWRSKWCNLRISAATIRVASGAHARPA